MALLNVTFNPAETQEIYKNDYDVLPAGNYNVIITKTDEKQTKDGSGTMLVIEMEVQDGEFQRRKLFDRINLQNRSAEAVAMGQKKIKQIMYCFDMIHINDSSDFHYKPIVAVVGIRKGNDRYPNDTNEVKRYEKAQGVTQGAPTFQHSAPPVQPQPQASAAPWAAGR